MRLLDIAGRCPVHRTLERGAAVVTTLGTAADLPPGAERELAGQHLADMEAACAD